ncbi:NVEALA domain-containing protein [Bacteroides caecimuris]|uniref:NVEALA domain-containing protein n=1 Tax=Bacteroides caecimuris TaxID=1796613 RepID=UPI001C3C5F00|nr:NVEALA domain-containing protein [Bacteroides caecimuris]
MKKLIVFLLCMVAALSTKYFVSHSNSKVHNTFLLYNVEALAAGEHAPITRCYGTGSLDCPVSHKKVEYIFGGYSLEE